MKAPPCSRSFLYDRPSTKTFTCRASWPPLRNFLPASSSFSVKRTPGARAAKLRKLRLFWGSVWICSGVTLVAISELRVSSSRSGALPTTLTSSPKVSPGERSKSACAVLVDQHLHRALARRERLGVHGEREDARVEAAERIAPLGVGDRGVTETRLGAHRRHRGVGHGSGIAADDAVDRRGRGLRQGGLRKEQRRGEQQKGCASDRVAVPSPHDSLLVRVADRAAAGCTAAVESRMDRVGRTT